MLWDWSYALEILPVLAKAAIITIEATLLGFVIAAILGLALAILRMQGPLVAGPVTLVMELVRSTPLLIQIFFLYFVLPKFGVSLDAFTAGVLALGVHYATYCSEVYRAGLENVPRGQWEAATALNLSPFTTFKDIILPQAIRRSCRRSATTSSRCSRRRRCSRRSPVLELMQTAKILGSESFRYVEPITLVGRPVPDHEPRLRCRHPPARAGAAAEDPAMTASESRHRW